jgi:hypothetical protein
MKRLGVIGLVLAAATASSCVDFQDGDGDVNACDNRAVLDGETLLALRTDVAPFDEDLLPPSDGTVEVRATVCGKRGTFSFKRLRGVPPQAALRYRESLYVGTGFFVATKAHPLHAFYAADLFSDPGDLSACRRRSFRGRVVRAPLVDQALQVDGAYSADRGVTIHPDMQADLPRVGGLPRVRTNQRVRIRGFQCGGEFVAMRIARDRTG